MKPPTSWLEGVPAYGILFEANPCPMWVYDVKTLAFLAVNEAAVDRYGFSRAEFGSMTIKQIRPPEDIPLLDQNLRTQTSGPERTGPWRHRAKDGEIIQVEVASRPIELEGRAARLVVVFDVTSTIEAAEALEQNRRRTDEIVATALDAIVSMDAAGTIVEFNPAAEKTFRISRDEALGNQLADLIIPPSFRARHEAGLARFLATGEARILGSRLELPARRSDGTEFPAELAITLDMTSGEPRFTGFIRDVTERMEAERAKEQLMVAERERRSEIEEMNASLERRVAERTDDLQAANAELEAFSYSVSHDLRAPLRAMDGFARILSDDFDARLGPEGSRYVGIIRNSSRHMGELIDDLLTFSRLSRAPVNRRSVDVNTLVAQVLDELGADRERVTITVEELPEADADPALLRVALSNLLSNALKYSGKREHPEIRIGCIRGDEDIYLVADNGVGFDMRYADKLFGVFQRLHSQDDYEGTGVGLATVQRIVHRHGGKVWAEAEVDGGATFFFTLGKGNG